MIIELTPFKFSVNNLLKTFGHFLSKGTSAKLFLGFTMKIHYPKAIFFFITVSL